MTANTDTNRQEADAIELAVVRVKKDGSPAPAPHAIELVVSNYLSALKNIGQTVQIVMPHLSKWLLDETKKQQHNLKRFVPDLPDTGEKQPVQIDSARDFAEFTSTIRRLEELQENRALPVLARSLFIQIFCEFDAFMGALLKTIYTRNTALLKGISREISLTELIEYETLEAVKRAMLDKEVETFRRDSYVEQFAQLEKKFGLTLKKFCEWGEFVELSQRRNIFTHNDGCVSDQYLAVCEREGWQFKVRPALGESLDVDIQYFGRALQVLSKIGYMLAHTLWSKVFPDEVQDMHKSLNSILYNCLEEKRWKVAAELGSFALSDHMRKNVSEIDFRIRVINTAIALKFSERDAEATSLLKTLDWSASYRDFKLALCVLEDKFEEAVSIMKSIGKTGEILMQHSYHTWPLFHKFRERSEFYSTYEGIYGEPYLAVVPTDGSSTDVALTSTKQRTESKIASTRRKTQASAETLPPNPSLKRTSRKRSAT